jgi:hypothetical protein
MQEQSDFSIRKPQWENICSIFPPSHLFLAVLFSSISAAAWATEAADGGQQTELAVQVRQRLELLENFNDKFYGADPKLGSSSDTYLLSRLRLGLSHQFNQHLSGKISLQDSRVFGWAFDDQDWVNSEFSGMEHNPQSDPLELGETWLQYKQNGFSAQAGRQPISYGNNRVFGPGEWKNSGKWVWDAVKASYACNKNWAEIFYGETMLHEPDVFSLEHRHGYVGAGLYGHFQVTDFLALEPIAASKNNDESDDYAEKELRYYGARLLLELDSFTADGTYMQQTGDITAENGGTTDSDAYGWNLDLEYRFNPQWAVGSTVSFASGDDKDTPDNERFDAVYGASDKYYGLMNFMSWSNLLDYGLLITFQPQKKLQVKAEYHQFHADQIDDKWKSYKSGLKTDSDHYGNEIDLAVKWNLNKTWKFYAGAGIFMPGDAIEEAAAAGQDFITDDTAYSGFLQITYSFSHVL